MATIPLTRSQQTFVKRLSGQTGLNSRVIAAWVLAEMGGASSGAAQSRERARNYNWLNIAYYDSGAGSITKDKTWRDPIKAADATAEFLEGKRFGASPGIRKILDTVGKDQNAQINAIARSGWASSGYNGGANLRSLLHQAPALGHSSVGDAIKQAAQPRAAAVQGTTTITPAPAPNPVDPSALMAALAKPQAAPAVASAPLAQPGVAGPRFSKTFRPVQSAGAPQAQQSGVDVLLAAAAQTPQGELPVAPTVTTTGAASSSAPAKKSQPSIAGTNGKIPGLPGGHSPLFELFWQGANGINAKHGKLVPQGFVDGHKDHVHVAAGPKTVVALGKLAQSMGLSVGENPHFGGVHPVHVQDSYHYREGGEAIDVSGGTPKRLAAYAHAVAKIFGIKA